jgi:hypothetical protein
LNLLKFIRDAFAFLFPLDKEDLKISELYRKTQSPPKPSFIYLLLAPQHKKLILSLQTTRPCPVSFDWVCLTEMKIRLLLLEKELFLRAATTRDLSQQLGPA